MTIEQIFYIVLLMSAAGSAMFALFKVVTALAGENLSPKWRYSALKACTLLFVLPLSLFGKLMPKATVPSIATTFAFTQSDTAQATATVPAAAGSNISLSFASVWALGVLLVVLWQAFCFIKLRLSTAKHVVKAGLPLQATAEECAAVLSIRQKPTLFISETASMPMLIGLFTPVMLLPSEASPKESIGFILKHELIHFKRKDLWLKIAFMLVKAVHWFNPLVFIACKELDLWCEYSCDAAVADGLCHEEKKQYVMAIILAAANVGRERTSFGTPFISAKKQIERRLDFIFNSDNSKGKKTLNRTATAFIAAVMITAGTFTAYASAPVAEPAPPEAVAPASSMVKKKISPPKESLVKEAPTYKSVAVPVTAEDSKQLVADGILPEINAACTRCQSKAYTVRTEKYVSKELYSRCSYYKHGEDIETPTTYMRRIECDNCGYSDIIYGYSVKSECKGYS